MLYSARWPQHCHLGELARRWICRFKWQSPGNPSFSLTSSLLQISQHNHNNTQLILTHKIKVKKNPALARLKSTESGFVEYTSSRDELVSFAHWWLPIYPWTNLKFGVIIYLAFIMWCRPDTRLMSRRLMCTWSFMCPGPLLSHGKHPARF